MGKYEALWDWIRENGTDRFKLTFDEIEKIAEIPMDHSFLTYKKALIQFGYKVEKISMKEQTVEFVQFTSEHKRMLAAEERAR